MLINRQWSFDLHNLSYSQASPISIITIRHGQALATVAYSRAKASISRCVLFGTTGQSLLQSQRRAPPNLWLAKTGRLKEPLTVAVERKERPHINRWLFFSAPVDSSNFRSLIQYRPFQREEYNDPPHTPNINRARFDSACSEPNEST